MAGRPTRPHSSPAGAPLDITHRPGGVGQRPGGGAPRSGGGGYAPHLPGGAPPSASRRQDPDYFAPPGSQDFFLQTAPEVTVTGPNTTVVLDSFQVPSGRVAVIRDITVSARDLTATSNIRFGITVDGSPVPGFGLMILAPRPATFASLSFLPESTIIRLSSQSTVSVFARVIDAAAYPVATTVHGWHYDAGIRRDYEGSY